MIRFLLLVLLPLQAWASAQPEQGENYYMDKERGWFWYEPIPEPPKKEDKEPAKKAQPAPVDPSLDPQSVLKAYQKRLDDAKALAVMDPTPQNVQRYMELQQEAMNRATLFADTWRRVVWSTPDLDYSLKQPVSRAGLDVRKQLVRQDKEQAIAALAKTDGLFWFFKESCPYCHAQAPILRAFADRYGISVIPITLDGGGVPEFPSPRRDSGWAAELGVNVTPALFMVNPRNKEIVPLGYGVLTEEDLKERIYAIAMRRVGDF